MEFILASQSLRRQDLLKQIGFIPSAILPSNIDETPLKKELPRPYVMRMATEKCQSIAVQHPNSVVLAADTIVAVGRRILQKPADATVEERFLQLLSGRRHRVYTAIAVAMGEKIKVRVGMTVVKFKRLTKDEISSYIKTNEWQGKAGGYTIQGNAAKFIEFIRGDEQSNVVGLPLSYTYKLLNSFGIKQSK